MLSCNVFISDPQSPAIPPPLPLPSQTMVEIVKIIPENNASYDPEVIPYISAQFNENMDASTINNNTFKLLEKDGNYITGAISYNSNDKRAFFKPASPLSKNTIYISSITKDVRSIDGNYMEEDYSWSFITGARSWTIMVYCDGDNDLEEYLFSDIEEMKNGYSNLQGLDVILLVDRIDGFSENESGLGENFTDTRLYRITSGNAQRIEGGAEFPEITVTSNYEANMGDAGTLRKFIRFCKAEYKASHYALILWNHGDGVRKKGGSAENSQFKAICSDDTNDGDILYTAEITDGLNSDDSVDLIGFDACLMGSVEVAYQYRPDNGDFHADVMVASPYVEWGYGWKYDKILSRLRSGANTSGETDTIAGGSEAYYDPATMTAQQLGGVIVEEQYDSTISLTNQTLSCYDLSKVGEVKSAVDSLAVSLYTQGKQSEFETVRGGEGGVSVSMSQGALHYFDGASNTEWLSFPFFDLYDLCERTNESLADAVMTAVENMVIYSFAGSDFSRFINGQNGVHIFFPEGDDRIYTSNSATYIHWAYQWWYNAIDTNAEYAEGYYYGKLSWCDDGATSGNAIVENWFEMLDAWFDESSARSGYSWNSYQY